MLIYSYAAVAAIIATAITWMIIKDRKEADTYSHLIQNNNDQKRGIPIPLLILFFSAFRITGSMTPWWRGSKGFSKETMSSSFYVQKYLAATQRYAEIKTDRDSEKWAAELV